MITGVTTAVRQVSIFGVCVCTYLQNDLIKPDQILWSWSSFVLICLWLLQFGLQCLSHALIPLHHRPQLYVG